MPETGRLHTRLPLRMLPSMPAPVDSAMHSVTVLNVLRQRALGTVSDVSRWSR